MKRKLGLFFKGFIPFIIVTIPLIMGIVLDCTHQGYIGMRIPKWILSKLSVAGHYLGIQYSGMLDILDKNVGIIMTIVSLFLSMHINISERSEKTAYGISRKKLMELSKVHINHRIRWVTYLSPMIMIICLNLSLCITGYLTFVYCYLFLMIEYFLYATSYSQERNRNAVIKIILKGEDKNSCQQCSLTRKEKTDKKILLENIGETAEKEQNWNEIESLYYNLLDSIKLYDAEKQYCISRQFYRMVYWRDSRRSRVVSMELLKDYWEKCDLEESENAELVLWGMTLEAFLKATDKELIEFFDWVLDSAGRSAVVWQKKQTSLSTDCCNYQYGLLCVLAEARMRKLYLKKQRLRRQMIQLWEKAKTVFWIEGENYDVKVQKMCEALAHEAILLPDVAAELQKDYKERKRNCLITQISLGIE